MRQCTAAMHSMSWFSTAVMLLSMRSSAIAAAQQQCTAMSHQACHAICRYTGSSFLYTSNLLAPFCFGQRHGHGSARQPILCCTGLLYRAPCCAPRACTAHALPAKPRRAVPRENTWEVGEGCDGEVRGQRGVLLLRGQAQAGADEQALELLRHVHAAHHHPVHQRHLRAPEPETPSFLRP